MRSRAPTNPPHAVHGVDEIFEPPTVVRRARASKVESHEVRTAPTSRHGIDHGSTLRGTIDRDDSRTTLHALAGAAAIAGNRP
jgi:hypothetical protein